MTDPAPLTEKAKEDERSAWANVLANGISGWSSFTDTGEAVDRRVEEGEHAESAPRAAEHRSDSGVPGASDPKRGAGDKPSVPRQGTSGDLSKKDGPAEAGEVDEKSGDKAGKAKAPGLDPGWKQYRRDVEWQCRWLELRMKEVGGHIERYERMLRGIEQAKAEVAKAKETKEMASASVMGAEGDVAERKGDDPDENAEAPAKGSEPFVAPMKRRRPRDPERAKPPPPVLAAHPLFDEAERRSAKRARDERAPAALTTAGRTRARAAAAAAREKEAQAKRDAALTHLTSTHARTDDDGSDSDLSTAALYEQIEVLQQRVTALHARLGQPAPAMTTGGAVAATAARAAGPTGLGGRLAGQWGSGPLYGNGLPQLKKQPSKRDDFDINNVVGAAPAGAKFVERAQHVDICTPGVRPAPEYPPAGKVASEDAGEDDASSEDTSDEAYVRRHTRLEVAERTARTLPGKKDKRGGPEKPAGAGGKVAAAAEDDADSARPRADGGPQGGPSKMDAEPAGLAEVDASALVG